MPRLYNSIFLAVVFLFSSVLPVFGSNGCREVLNAELHGFSDMDFQLMNSLAEKYGTKGELKKRLHRCYPKEFCQIGFPGDLKNDPKKITQWAIGQNVAVIKRPPNRTTQISWSPNGKEIVKKLYGMHVGKIVEIEHLGLPTKKYRVRIKHSRRRPPAPGESDAGLGEVETVLNITDGSELRFITPADEMFLAAGLNRVEQVQVEEFPSVSRTLGGIGHDQEKPVFMFSFYLEREKLPAEFSDILNDLESKLISKEWSIGLPNHLLMDTAMIPKALEGKIFGFWGGSRGSLPAPIQGIVQNNLNEPPIEFRVDAGKILHTHVRENNVGEPVLTITYMDRNNQVQTQTTFSNYLYFRGMENPLQLTSQEEKVLRWVPTQSNYKTFAEPEGADWYFYKKMVDEVMGGIRNKLARKNHELVDFNYNALKESSSSGNPMLVYVRSRLMDSVDKVGETDVIVGRLLRLKIVTNQRGGRELQAVVLTRNGVEFIHNLALTSGRGYAIESFLIKPK